MSTKQEKKLMEERIAKVREVVHNVSTNDIILALHNFDMNIEKTIHAFCEGGFQAALGDWEKTGGSIKKKGHKKTTANPSGKSSSTASSANYGNKVSQLATSSISSSLSSIGYAANGYVPNSSASPTPQQRTIDKPALLNGGQTAFDPPAIAPDSNRVIEKIRYEDVLPKQNLVETEQKSALSSQQFVNKTSQKSRNDGCSPEEYLAYCFKEIREALDVREQQLLSELSSATNAVASLLCDPSDVIALIGRMGEVKRNNLPPQVFKSPIAPTVPALPSQNDVKRPNSPPSSQVSSVGEDSGLGQISPIHQAKSKAVVAQVEENGIMMESDALSADQLAELQRNIHEQLRAKGIDPSVFSEIGTGLSGGTGASRNRRPPPKHGSGGAKPLNGHSNVQGRRNDNGRPSRATGGEKQSGGKAKEGGGKQRAPVELSILQ